MKKLGLISLVIVLLSGLIFTGCALEPTPDRGGCPQQQQAAVAEVESQATELIDQSGAPLSFQEASFITTVTEANRDAIVDDIMETSATLIGSDFVCTGIMTLQEGLDEGLLTTSDVAEYRTFVDGLVEVDDYVVMSSWVRTSDSLSLNTLAVVDDADFQLTYDSMISSWFISVPYPGIPNLPVSSDNRTWTWEPYPDGVTVAERLFGDDAVWVNPVMIVTFNETGRVVSETEDPQVSTFLAKAEVSQKAEVIPGEEGDCKRWSFRVHWAGPLAKIKIKAGTDSFNFEVEFSGIGCHGTDLKVYELCYDGSCTVLEP